MCHATASKLNIFNNKTLVMPSLKNHSYSFFFKPSLFDGKVNYWSFILKWTLLIFFYASVAKIIIIDIIGDLLLVYEENFYCENELWMLLFVCRSICIFITCTLFIQSIFSYVIDTKTLIVMIFPFWVMYVVLTLVLGSLYYDHNISLYIFNHKSFYNLFE